MQDGESTYKIVRILRVSFFLEIFIFSANESGDERRDKTKKRENGGVVGWGKYS